MSQYCDFCLYADRQTSQRMSLDRWDSSSAGITFTSISERNGGLETGLKFFKLFIFFRRDLTAAVLKQG